MNVTKHARERWAERVNPKAGENVDADVLESFKSATYVWAGGEPGKAFYVNKDFLLFVVDTAKQSIVTVYELEYGFPDDLDRHLATELLKRIDELKLVHAKEDTECEELWRQLEGGIQMKEKERGQLLHKVNMVESDIKALKHQQEQARQHVAATEYEIEKLVSRLVNSRRVGTL